jgi:hypothetical protein
MLKKWMGMSLLAVAFMMVAGGCAKKEEAAQEAVEEVDTTPAETSPSAAGMYMATLPGGTGTVMLTLNADNTASMSVDNATGQPAAVENGSWTWNAGTNSVDLTVNRDVSGTMVSSTMSFAAMGDTLTLNNPVEGGYGAGLKLVKSAAGEEHSH